MAWSALAFACAASQCLAQQSIPASDIRSLLIAAIEAPAGQARGLLAGDAAEAIKQRFKSTSPIHVDVSTIRRYAQPGCSRLNVRVWQDDVQLPGTTAPQLRTLNIGVNYCRDGRPPQSLD